MISKNYIIRTYNLINSIGNNYNPNVTNTNNKLIDWDN